MRMQMHMRNRDCFDLFRSPPPLPPLLPPPIHPAPPPFFLFAPPVSIYLALSICLLAYLLLSLGT